MGQKKYHTSSIKHINYRNIIFEIIWRKMTKLAHAFKSISAKKFKFTIWQESGVIRSEIIHTET